MRKGDKLFVYGTLRIGENMGLDGGYMAPKVRYLGNDLITGFIYDLGSFPGAKVTTRHFDGTQAAVVGDVFEIIDEGVVASLDSYEGYPRLYNRVETETASGDSVWVYTYNGQVSPGELIVGGDWCQRVRKRA